jgi:hypothetical protein
MGNKRVFYACQGLMLDGKPLYGVQNVSVRTEQNTNVVENWGSLNIGGVAVDTPRSTITISRIIASPNSGVPQGSGTYGPIVSGDLSLMPTNHNRQLCLFFANDTEQGINDQSTSERSVSFNDCSINSLAYSISVEGFLAENTEIIAYNKVENSGCPISAMDFGVGLSGIYANPIQRQDINSFNFSDKVPSGTIQDINISIPFNIQTVDEFGTALSRHSKRYRFPTLPIASTLSVSAIYQNTDGFDNYMFAEPTGTTSTCDNMPPDFPQVTGISIFACGSGFGVDLGNCILESIDYGGGDVAGGNAILTYDFVCYNSGHIHG